MAEEVEEEEDVENLTEDEYDQLDNDNDDTMDVLIEEEIESEDEDIEEGVAKEDELEEVEGETADNSIVPTAAVQNEVVNLQDLDTNGKDRFTANGEVEEIQATTVAEVEARMRLSKMTLLRMQMFKKKLSYLLLH